MSNSQWDRGFTAGAKAGTKAERERIKQLLTAQPNGIWQKFLLKQVIALIERKY